MFYTFFVTICDRYGASVTTAASCMWSLGLELINAFSEGLFEILIQGRKPDYTLPRALNSSKPSKFLEFFRKKVKLAQNTTPC